jgi:hypothetical protein
MEANDKLKLLGGLALAFAFAYTCTIISNFHELDSIKLWPVVPGSVTKSEHLKQDRFQSSDYRIQYEYLVKNQRFSSSEFRVWGANKSDYEKYQPGKPVQVHYNPASPSMSFVEVGINEENVPKHIIGNVLFYCLAIALLIAKPRRSES